MGLSFGNFIANVWGRAFLKNCQRQLKSAVPDLTSSVGRIRAQGQEVFDARAGSLPDKQGRLILGMCSLVLAAYREAEGQLGDPPRALGLVRTAFGDTFSWVMRMRMKVWLWLFRDPVGSLQRRSLVANARKTYGAMMEFDEAKSDEAAELIVRKCAFHEFFVDNGVPELTPVVCAWDNLWMDTINRSGRPVYAERPSTLSTGGDCCRFRFVRGTPKEGTVPLDVIDLELAKPTYRQA